MISATNTVSRAVRLEGLVAAAYTPMHADGTLNLQQCSPMVDYLVSAGVAGLYVAGSTGEGPSLSAAERNALARAYVDATRGRLPVIVQVGHNSLAEAKSLAAAAQDAGADMLSACSPSYFKIDSVETLVDCMAEISAAAPELPFYYYHIPRLTGVALDMVDFLRLGADRIPGLSGIKFSTPEVFAYQACLEVADGRYDVLWGCDEMLLSALVVGARGAIGSTYNFAAPLYRAVIEAFGAGDLAAAAELQGLAAAMVRIFNRYPFHSGMKAFMAAIGVDCGASRLPMRALADAERTAMLTELEELGAGAWARPGWCPPTLAP